jgi:hypothetical protein
MKNIIISAIIFGLIWAFTSCEKQVSIAPAPYKDQLSIECLLVANQKPKLYLNKSVAYFSNLVSTKDLFISDATVKIISGDVIDNLKTAIVHNDFLCRDEYFWQGDLEIVEGKTYTLEVTYKGQVFTANTTVNLNKPVIDSVGYTSQFSDLYGEHEGVIFYFKDIPNQSNFYRYEMARQVDSTVRTANDKIYRTECNGANFFSVNEIGRSIYDDKNKNGLPMSFVIEPSYTHKKGSEAQVYLQTVDEKSAKFYDALDRQKLSSYNPFVEPVFLNSQIEGCIGVFGTMNISEPMHFVYPE